MTIQSVKDKLDGGYLVVLWPDPETGDVNKLHVPNSPRNGDYQMVQAWIAEGNTPDPADPAPAASTPPLTAEELASQMIADGTMTQGKIDALKAAR